MRERQKLTASGSPASLCLPDAAIYRRFLLFILPLIGGELVYVVINPVGIQGIGMGSPHEGRLFAAVIFFKIVFGRLNGESLSLVPQILFFQGAAVIFRVAEDESPESEVLFCSEPDVGTDRTISAAVIAYSIHSNDKVRPGHPSR